MNTPAHLIFASAAFASPDKPKHTWAALIGALMPDLSLYLLAGWHLFILKTDPSYVFDILYFSPEWQRIFAIDNSFFVWGAVIGLGLILKKPWLWIFGASAFLHIAFDFPLHHDDGRAHFWPLSDWIFHSPVSYWDSRAYGDIVGVIEVMAVAGLTYLLWRRFRGQIMAYAFLVLGLLQVAPFVIFSLMF